MALRRVMDAWMETHNVRTIRFDFRDRPVTFKPGQFVMVGDQFKGYSKPVRRAYSIASTPLERDYVDISVKREVPGLMSVRLTEVPVGTEMEVTDPNGKYYWDPEQGKKILLLGAGSGIVPLYSIARTMLETPVPGADIQLFYSVKSTADIIYKKGFEELAERYPNFKYHLTVTRASAKEWSGRHGRITTDWVRETVGDVGESVSYICGPGPMVASMEQICVDLGMPPERINTEKW